MFEFFSTVILGTGLMQGLSLEILSHVIVERPPQVLDFREVPQIEAVSFLLGDVESGQVIMAQGRDDPRAIASLTKLMTAVVALEHYPHNTRLAISPVAVAVEGTRVPLAQGDTLTLGDLIALAMVRSGNDAAWSIAEHMEGGVPAFVQEMNTKARDLGMYGTVYVNPTGLDDPAQVSTARDLFTLTRYIVRTHPELLTIAKQSELTVSGLLRTYHVQSTNALLGLDFLDVEGLKTGTTDMAGQSYIGMVKSPGGGAMY